MSARLLSKYSNHSRDKIYRIINYWLSKSPSDDFSNLKNQKHLIIDGTFLHRPVSIIALMYADTNSIIDGQYDVRENSIPQLTSFLKPLKEKGLCPISCTTDGNPQVIKTLKSLWPSIIIQRCVVHIQRQGLVWCRQYPKRPDARKLRKIFLKTNNINNKKSRIDFMKEISEWEFKYGENIKTKPGRGRVFSDLKRARSMLIKALPNMFHYLENPNIPRSTNALEGYFSRLKGNYRNHRGLAKEKRGNYFDWYFNLRPR